MKIIKTAACLIVFALSAKSEPQVNAPHDSKQLQPIKAQAELYALAGIDHVKLMWIPNQWELKQLGFNLKRRRLNGQWKKLNSSPLKPEVSANKNYGDYGLNQQQITKLQDKYSHWIASGDWSAMSTKEMLAELQGEGGLRSAFIYCKEDFNQALMTGFGYLDNDFSKNDVFEYGLFSLDEQGNEGSLLSSLIVKYHSKNDPIYQVELSFKNKGYALELEWNLSLDKFKQGALQGFTIYRKNESGEFVDISDGVLYPEIVRGKLNQDNKNWYFEDDNCDPSKAQLYAIVPSDYFQSSFSKDFIYSYDPEANAGLSDNPVISDIKNLGPGNMQINWKLKDPNEANRVSYFKLTITAYGVEGDKDGSGLKTVLAKKIAPKQRSFVDKTAKIEGKTYAYQLRAIDRNEEELSTTKNIIYEKVLIPNEIKGLVADVSKVEGDIQVHLKWDANESGTAYYRLFHDFRDSTNSGTMLEQGGIGNVYGNSYELIFGSSLGREATVGLVPVSTTGDRGTMATIKVFMPNLAMDFPDSLDVTKIDRNNLKIDWTYDDNVEDLNGFRLYLDDKIILDEKVLNKDLRSYTVALPDMTEGQSYQYALSAVGTVAESEKMWANDIVVEATPEGYKPEDFTVIQNGDQVSLTWKEVDLADKGLSGFRIMVDNLVEYEYNNISSGLITDFSYNWTLPNEARARYHFQVVPIKTDQDDGPEARATLKLNQ
ncbi:hypothetical protein LNTAR_22959 [Lentisphaera araneosa HTCC2155]|uniref:Fibronectin type-III domain-containing protein n=1 Tax=Lentisphaera araneosa HTCC2155 TaxID=313628 RepID=A6DGI3_9BACT|nr:hypothetical protein [Lentisphaera araneosa]EDM29300.1 hypothetical protein LNTAR_22959 [Lentisphaera araneosa HTCC2155]